MVSFVRAQALNPERLHKQTAAEKQNAQDDDNIMVVEVCMVVFGCAEYILRHARKCVATLEWGLFSSRCPYFKKKTCTL